VSIVSLFKVTLYGHMNDKASILEDLQEMGCLHIIPLQPEKRRPGGGGPTSQAREALKFLLSCPQKRRQVRDPSKLDAVAVEERALAIQKRMQALQDERDFLHQRILDVRPWGDFTYPPPEALQGLRLWFFIVPLNDMKEVRATDLIWQVMARDNRFAYVVVVSKNEPKGMPVLRTRTGSKSLSALELRLDEVELELEDLQAERVSLTRWCRLYASSLFQLEDRETLLDATQDTFDAPPLFALQAWTPSEEVSRLSRYTHKEGLALEIQDPGPQDNPPTLLHNRPSLASGQDLVSFYMTPNYWLWDPSAVVFFSFAVFFAMILSDAGYALIMGLGLGLGWKKMGRSDSGRRLRVLFGTLVGATAVWGILVGSYFGFAPPQGSLLGGFNTVDLNDFHTMMRLSIFIGVGHLVLANLADMHRRGVNTSALAPLGWIVIFVGAVLLWMGADNGAPNLLWKTSGVTALMVGAAAVVFFTPTDGTFFKRLTAGLLALAKITNAFGDALSYLRLFALGLASASLAVAFNDLAQQVRSELPGFGILLALLVFLIGHSLNFVLAVVSGFIHGLRLNFIEFFNWSIPEEGKPFRAFARKETSAWNQ
jgi:V/A-type H+/Na+-transporting ATPase subunit I